MFSSSREVTGLRIRVVALVILAEDNVDHQHVMAQVVRRLGHDVTVVGDGPAAPEAAAQRRPDLVIADVDMPRLNGLDMCRAIRDDPALSDVPVVVLVTALL